MTIGEWIPGVVGIAGLVGGIAVFAERRLAGKVSKETCDQCQKTNEVHFNGLHEKMDGIKDEFNGKLDLILEMLNKK